MRVGLRLSLASLAHLEDVFEDLESRLQDVGPNLADIAVDFVHDVLEESFAEEGSGGRPWAPLAFSTAMERVRQGYEPFHPILVRSGGLRSGLIDSDDPHQVLDIRENGGDLSVSIGTDDPRFAWHQQGTPTMPARPMWPEGVFETQIMDELEQVFIGIVSGTEKLP